METLQQYVQFLQSCITPVALISGVGLILLTVTNRLGRTIDRIRHLVDELDSGHMKKTDVKKSEIRILYQRSKVLRSSIGAMVVSIIASSLIIPVLFFMTLVEINLKMAGYMLFVVSVLSILVSAAYLFKDVILTLKAIKLEARDYL